MYDLLQDLQKSRLHGSMVVMASDSILAVSGELERVARLGHDNSCLIINSVITIPRTMVKVKAIAITINRYHFLEMIFWFWQ